MEQSNIRIFSISSSSSSSSSAAAADIEGRKNGQFKKPRTCGNRQQKFDSTISTFVTEEIGTAAANGSSSRHHPTRNRVNFNSLDAYTRHKLLVNYYVLTHPDAIRDVMRRDTTRDKTDFAVLAENHRFVWSESDIDPSTLTWGQRVAKKYYDKLFKEYCIIDLSRYAEKQFGMRWRTERELIDGKGQFICGAKRCPIRGGLTSWEVLFAYREHGERKSALVKVRLCPECSDKLNHRHAHKKAHKNDRKRTKKTTDADSDRKEISIKEEIVTDAEEDESDEFRNASQKVIPAVDGDYQDLIDKIWKQPIKVEADEAETSLEDEVDDYLNNLFV